MMKSQRRIDDRQSLLNASDELGVEFSFAFQPIVDTRIQEISSFEALIRGARGESAASIMNQMVNKDVSMFDEIFHQKIFDLADRLNFSSNMNINLPAGALYNMDLNTTGNFKTALPNGLLVENIVFEVTETESLTDETTSLKNLRLLKDFGFKTAIDDFGVGYSGLKLLMEYQPNFVKLDRYMISDIQENKIKQVIFYGVQEMCEDLSIEVVAEGVENEEEYFWLEKQGIRLFQGYYFAKPAFEALPTVIFNNASVNPFLNTAF